MSNIVLSSYPLSSSFKTLIKQKAGESSEFVSLNEVKNRGVKGLLQYIFSLKHENLFIAVEEETAVAILPTIKILVALSRCARLNVIYSDGKIEGFGRLQVISYLFYFAFVNVYARLVRLYSFAEVLILRSRSRVDVQSQNARRILYVKSNLWFGVKAGGSVGHIAGVINGFLRKKWEVIFFGAEKPHMVDKELTYKQVEIPRVLAYPPEINNFIFNKKIAQSMFAESGSNTVIYQRLSINNYSGVLASRKLNIALIIEYNGSEVWVSNNWGKKLNYQRHAELCEEVCLKHAHLLVTISDVLRDELIARGVAPERIVTYPNCIDERIFDPSLYSKEQKLQLRKSLGFAEDDIVCTFVGTFGAWHGVDFLADAITKLINEREDWLKKYKVKFLLIGDGSLMQKVKDILSHAKSNEYFVLTGLIEQQRAPLHLAASDVLLSPHVQNADGSKFFGSPTKLFEYMAMEKPIIASRLEQIEQVLSEKNTENKDQIAVLFEPNNRTEFIAKLQILIDNLGDAQAMAKNCRKEALIKYTWSTHVDKIITSMELI